MIETKNVLLLSGGIDSFAAYHLLKHDPKLLYLEQEHWKHFDTMYFNLGLVYSNVEIETIKNCDPKVKIFDISKINLNQIDPIGGFIPNRNLLFFTLASAFGYRNIMVCANNEDRIQDNTPSFHSKSSDILTESLEENVIIFSPISMFSKYEICKLYIDEELGSPTDLAFNTFSCYNPGSEWTKEECLSCKACFRKNTVLHKLGLTREFKNKGLVESYLADTTIPEDRMKDIRSYAGKIGVI